MSVSPVEELVRFVAIQLVNSPGEIETRTQQLDQGEKVFLSVAESDRGNVIGKGGRTARALRGVVRAAGAVRDKRFQVEIED